VTQALEMIRSNPYHLVISDVMMPGMDGIDLLQHLRELQQRPAVIMITGQSEVDLTVKAMKTGAVDYLKKPFKLEDLIFRVNLYLRKRAGNVMMTRRSRNGKKNCRSIAISSIRWKRSEEITTRSSNKWWI